MKIAIILPLVFALGAPPVACIEQQIPNQTNSVQGALEEVEANQGITAMYGKHHARTLDSENRRTYIWKVPVQAENFEFDLYVVSGKERGTTYEIQNALKDNEATRSSQQNS